MATFIVNLNETISALDTLSFSKTIATLGIAPKQVKALVLNASDDRQGIKISWNALEENVQYYEVYRLGAVVQAENSTGILAVVDGDTLDLVVRGGAVQTITFSGAFITSGAATVAEIVANINDQLVGAKAFISQNPLLDSLYIRVSGDGQGKTVEILGGTANAEIQFPTGKFNINRDKSRPQLIATVFDPEIEFEDRDGSVEDHYYVRAVNSLGLAGQNSVIKSLQRFVDEVPSRIVVYGLLFDPSGQPIKNERVILRPPEDSRPSLDANFGAATFGVGFQESIVKTDGDGYFEIEALSGLSLRLLIPVINYDHVVAIPEFNVNFTSLSVTLDDFRSTTTTGLISGAIVGKKGKVELTIGEVKVINEESDPIPVVAPDGIPVFGTVSISNLPPDFADIAQENTLQSLLAKFDGNTDIGNVTILNSSLAINTPAPIDVQGTVNIGNFPATQNVSLVGQPIDVDLISGAQVIANIGSPGLLSTEATLSTLSAKFVEGTIIGDVKISGQPIQVTWPTALPVSGTVSVGNFPATQDVNVTNAVTLNQPVTVQGTVDIGSFPAGSLATEATLQSLLDRFDGTNDIGDVSILGNVPITTPSPIDVQGTVNIGNFPATQNVNVINAVLAINDNASSLTVDTDSGPLDVTFAGPVPVDINSEGGLALESTLSAISAKLIDGNDIGDVTLNNTASNPVPITNDGSPLSIAGGIDFNEDSLPLSRGDQWLYRDQSILPMAISPTDTDISFGFTSIGVAIFNDEDPDVPGQTEIQYSWDNFVTIAGEVFAGEAIIFDNLRRTQISLRSIMASRPYRLKVWGE